MYARTISNLSRDMCVSRPRIYRAMERLGIKKNFKQGYTEEEWEALKNELMQVSRNNAEKREDAKKLNDVHKSKGNENKKGRIKLSEIDIATTKERLTDAKQEYEHNKALIALFQAETIAYFKKNGKTTMMSHNGAMTSIPSVVNNEKYVKLNISLSTLISKLEADLELETDGVENDVFNA